MIEAGKKIGLEYCEDVNDLPPGDTDCLDRCRQTRGDRIGRVEVRRKVIL